MKFSVNEQQSIGFSHINHLFTKAKLFSNDHGTNKLNAKSQEGIFKHSDPGQSRDRQTKFLDKLEATFFLFMETQQPMRFLIAGTR